MPLEHRLGDQLDVLTDGEYGFRGFPDQAIAVISKTPLKYLIVAGDRTHLMSGDSFESSIPIATPLFPSGWTVETPLDLADANALPSAGKSLIVCGTVGMALHIRIFDASGKMVVDLGEGDLSDKRQQLAKLKPYLEHLRHGLDSPKEREGFIADVLEIVDHAFPTNAVRLYDENYAGIGSVYPRDRPEVGFFHAERPTRGRDSAGTRRFYATVWLAVFDNESQSFRKIDPIITGVPLDMSSERTAQGVGDVSVCPDSTGEWLYAYYTEHSQIDRATDQSRPVVICMARSRVSDGGRPGTWWKYFNGSFGEQGLEGKDEALLEGWAPNVHYLEPMKKYLMICCLHGRGIGFCESGDGIHWTDPTVLISAHDAPFKGKEIATHPSFYIEHCDKDHADGYLLYGYSKNYDVDPPPVPHDPPSSPHYFVKRSLRFDLTP